MAANQFGLMILSICLALPTADRALAQSDEVCTTLYQQLTSGTEVIGTTIQTRALRRALLDKDQEIRAARQRLRDMGCSSGSVVVIGGANQDACSAQQSAIDGMRKARDEMASGRLPISNRSGATREQRQKILDAIAANGCQSDTFPTLASTDPDSDTDIRRPVETFIPPREDKKHFWPSVIRPTLGFEVGSPLKTMCVRTCDGGFFPISSNASPASFQRDAETCAAMCPGTQTELFYSSLYDTETGDMISAATGEPYSQMSTANLYKQRKPGADPQCGCEMEAYYKDIMRREKLQQTPSGEGYSTITTVPPPAKKPVAEAVTPSSPLPAADERDYDPEKRNIRQVGPSFIVGDDMTETPENQEN
ncbi:DUF2865 domain-containing protein [Rhizobium sp. PAMB 3182]